MTAGSPERLRADARRNRRKILATAALAFVEDGPYVPMEEIARRAGVGVGTLYRHFPDRDALIMAVVRDNLAATLVRARQAAAEEEQAWDALVRSMSASDETRLVLRLPTLFSPAIVAAIQADPEIRRIRRELVAVIDSLVRRAQNEGSLRADVGTGDLIHLFSLLLRGVRRTPDDTADVALERAQAVILDGLRAHSGDLLPGRPLSATDLEAE
ncbi:TetR family transcriptional regulator [Parafrankia soli]|uniref:TetR family transcriptional regulator n=1 Tax=Parafrankia soli TaxID=2599596 RepID=A0A1S1PMQ7_9ACTN|nr:TetR/AcrR family transcriptional regulator [Parafrankia soli]OHV22175.1 TetR family transcriptional regulator [Parafrankia soli]